MHFTNFCEPLGQSRWSSLLRLLPEWPRQESTQMSVSTVDSYALALPRTRVCGSAIQASIKCSGERLSVSSTGGFLRTTAENAIMNSGTSSETRYGISGINLRKRRTSFGRRYARSASCRPPGECVAFYVKRRPFYSVLFSQCFVFLTC